MTLVKESVQNPIQPLSANLSNTDIGITFRLLHNEGRGQCEKSKMADTSDTNVAKILGFVSN